MAKFIKKLASIADVASLSKKERIAYDENLRKYRDTVAVMEGQWLEQPVKQYFCKRQT